MSSLIYSSAGHHAPASQWPEQEKDWMTAVLSLPLSISDFLASIGLNGLFGKTSRERLLLTGGGDLKLFFREITEIGYGLSWRILDARFFRSAQRRRRLFAVGHFGDWRPSAAVLFERPRLSGDFKESGKITDTVTARAEKDIDKASVYDWHRQTGEMRPQLKTCYTATANWGTGGNNMPLVKTYATESYSKISASETGATLTHGVVDGFIRKLTPIECERLQNFPDNWTDIPYRGKEHAPHSLRYKALGNSMNVNVMRWIGERIKAVNEILEGKNAREI